MSRNTNGPLEGEPQGDRSSRRDLLKRALVVLGAGVLIQPNGGVSGLALADDAPPLKQKGVKNKNHFDVPPPSPKGGANPPGKHPKLAPSKDEPYKPKDFK